MDKAEKQHLATVASLMRELKQTQLWACYADGLRAMMESEVEAVLIAPLPDVAYHQGRVQGLRIALSLPDTLINRSQHA